ncbi:glycosyltransferase [Maribacter sp. Asnod2-G09]|uniref:glycosyltransferase n=1 Tax=Maribacter sp. Asnod2-G09 TaxID=3160577 RepID=UPI003863F209
MHQPFVQIIILNWKKPEDTVECLASLERITYSNYGIILIDNFSNDNSEERITGWLDKSSFTYSKFYTTANKCSEIKIDVSKKVQFVLNHENSGFAKGNNLGITASLVVGANLVLLLNNDTEVNEDFLDVLIQAKINTPEIAVFTPQIRLYKPKDVLWNCGGKLILGGFWKKYYYPYQHISKINEKKPIKPITFITGCALLYNAHELGKLTEDFFFGEEDFEFSLRMKKKNKKIGCVMDSIIYHKVGTSLSSVNTIGKRYIHILNRLINTRRNNFNLSWPFLALSIILYNMIGLIKNENLSIVKALKFSFSLLRDSVNMNTVDEEKFIDTLYKRKW